MATTNEVESADAEIPEDAAIKAATHRHAAKRKSRPAEEPREERGGEVHEATIEAVVQAAWEAAKCTGGPAHRVMRIFASELEKTIDRAAKKDRA